LLGILPQFTDLYVKTEIQAQKNHLKKLITPYVLHLDPWWNPAIEDQASDRAHRIGQLRPVTI